MSGFRPAFAGVMAGVLLCSGCSSTAVIRTKKVPLDEAKKVPLSVAFKRPADPKQEPTLFKDSLCGVTIHIRIGRSVVDAVQGLLEAGFERVIPFSDQNALPRADLVATTLMDRSEFTLKFSDPESKEEVLSLTNGFASPFYYCSMGLGALQYIPPFYFLFPVTAANLSGKYKAYYDRQYGDSLQRLSEQLGKNLPGLHSYKEYKARAAEAEKAGDLALEAGDRAQAFERYGAVLKIINYGTQQYMRVLDKYVPLIAQASLPPIPEEARRFMTVGQTRFKEAKDNSGFYAAIRDLQKAVDAAPWWPATYFNLAVAQEGAKNYKDAIASFNRYLLAAPDAQDAAEIRKRTYALEAKTR